MEVANAELSLVKKKKKIHDKNVDGLRDTTGEANKKTTTTTQR